MIEVKVECDCGQHFMFEVEPVNGRMPQSVACPTCGADGTPKANAFIQSQLAASLPPPPAPARGLGIAPASVPASRPAPSRTVHQTHPPAHASSGPVLKPIHAQSGEAPTGKLLLAIGCSLAAAVAGMFAWFLLIKWTGYEIGYAAWGLGLLAGGAGRIILPEGSIKLGLCAGLFALIAILGGQYLATKSMTDELFSSLGKDFYQSRLEFAKSAAQANTDEEIRNLLAIEGEIKPEEISAEDVRAFREEELPELKELAEGRISESDYLDKLSLGTKSFEYHFMILKSSFGWFTLLWLLLGVGSAVKLGSSGFSK